MGSICFPEVSTDMVPSLMTSLQSLSPTRTIHTVSIVVGSKQQASLYADVLKNTVTSNSASMNPAPLSSASTSDGFVWSSNERELIKSPRNISEQSIVWKYIDDSRIFSSYLPADSAKIKCVISSGIPH